MRSRMNETVVESMRLRQIEYWIMKHDKQQWIERERGREGEGEGEEEETKEEEARWKRERERESGLTGSAPEAAVSGVKPNVRGIRSASS